jgi:glycine/D-amino acid oxidase-like deaminating enzyme
VSGHSHADSLADARPQPFWLDDPSRPAPLDPLSRNLKCDLAIVGGGFSGLWTALLAKERDPDRSVILLEGERIGWAASGRNGGFCEYSLTHGLPNGIARFPDELRTLVRLGTENLEAMGVAIAKYGIDCAWERTGELNVATMEWQVTDLREHVEIAAQYGEEQEYLDTDAVRTEVNSPTYLAGIWDRRGCAMLNPAKLAWGLRDACLSLGVQIFEGTRVAGLGSELAGPVLRTSDGRTVSADRVALATNVFTPLIRRIRPYVLPLYDYALMTEPLTEDQMASVGWQNRQGLADWANLYHYYRLTEDNRILWGGYDVVYHYGNRIAPELDQRPETFVRLAGHFFDTFPQLQGLRFSHAWGGVIDTCARFCAFFGTAHKGRVAYATGFTGLGVGATRFGAHVMLDLLTGQPTEVTELKMVRSKPLPFPPEPVRSLGVKLTRSSLEHADRNGGRRNLFLKTMDVVGLGFDS